MNATQNERTVATCRVCDARITQREIDEAEGVYSHDETLCPVCAESLARDLRRSEQSQAENGFCD